MGTEGAGAVAAAQDRWGGGEGKTTGGGTAAKGHDEEGRDGAGHSGSGSRKDGARHDDKGPAGPEEGGPA